jgi:hypothetical protein
MDALPPESQARCDLALAYIEQMVAWYDEEMEEEPKRVFAHRILHQADKRTPFNTQERAWLEERINAEY